ncbi:Serine/threonine protein kinase [Chondrus crispus]|uniref:Serine/threonine protein kinase n=1 Tax=Chondrus crispus TaxID=2769 RepID=R7Q4R6_CHOCR|nr:Serine/threonine protein kinase [Chondrus crispus]CDF33522.1 Serine/threonine protein kinase [Chondrus crispus]|eukprot:XP_005713325.1 Serine/threonine protein kinase [Chondrus crispus]
MAPVPLVGHSRVTRERARPSHAPSPPIAPVALHYPLRHPNIIRLHAVHPARPPHHHLSSTPSAQSLSLALVTELAPAGDMFAEVAAAGSLPPPVLRRRLADIANALSYLHHEGIAHLDLKLENVVISKSNTAKLADFGCAARIAHKNPNSSLRGTLHYLAPELINDPSLPPSPTADAWSMGVLAYTALVGAYPFNGARPGNSEQANDRATKYRILHAAPHRFPSALRIPDDLLKIIRGLLHKDPAKRMTISEVYALLSSARNTTKSIIKTPNPQRPSPDKIFRPPSPASPINADFHSNHSAQFYGPPSPASNRPSILMAPTSSLPLFDIACTHLTVMSNFRLLAPHPVSPRVSFSLLSPFLCALLHFGAHPIDFTLINTPNNTTH